jgi:hypothetical protein
MRVFESRYHGVAREKVKQREQQPGRGAFPGVFSPVKKRESRLIRGEVMVKNDQIVPVTY